MLYYWYDHFTLPLHFPFPLWISLYRSACGIGLKRDYRVKSKRRIHDSSRSEREQQGPGKQKEREVGKSQEFLPTKRWEKHNTLLSG